MLRPVASACSAQHLCLRTANALQTLQLKAGDQVRYVVERVDPVSGEVEDVGHTVTVSSIGSSGLVYFRGGNGACGWPARLSPIHPT